MFITILFIFTLNFSNTANAQCPNAFTFDEKNLCADLKWEAAEVQIGEELMSPVLNIGSPLPFNTYLSKVWVQIWEQGDSQRVLLFPVGLRIVPYMTMLDGMHHDAFASLTVDKDKGVELSQMKFDMMEGCWYITLQAEGLFHMIKILNYSNLNDEENFEQQMFCEICTSNAPKPDNETDSGQGQHNH